MSYQKFGDNIFARYTFLTLRDSKMFAFFFLLRKFPEIWLRYIYIGHLSNDVLKKHHLFYLNIYWTSIFVFKNQSEKKFKPLFDVF